MSSSLEEMMRWMSWELLWGEPVELGSKGGGVSGSVSAWSSSGYCFFSMMAYQNLRDNIGEIQL
jgi:hypothetical protein